MKRELSQELAEQIYQQAFPLPRDDNGRILYPFTTLPSSSVRNDAVIRNPSQLFQALTLEAKLTSQNISIADNGDTVFSLKAAAPHTLGNHTVIYYGNPDGTLLDFQSLARMYFGNGGNTHRRVNDLLAAVANTCQRVVAQQEWESQHARNYIYGVVGYTPEEMRLVYSRGGPSNAIGHFNVVTVPIESLEEREEKVIDPRTLDKQLNPFDTHILSHFPGLISGIVAHSLYNLALMERFAIANQAKVRIERKNSYIQGRAASSHDGVEIEFPFHIPLERACKSLLYFIYPFSIMYEALLQISEKYHRAHGKSDKQAVITEGIRHMCEKSGLREVPHAAAQLVRYACSYKPTQGQIRHHENNAEDDDTRKMYQRRADAMQRRYQKWFIDNPETTIAKLQRMYDIDDVSARLLFEIEKDRLTDPKNWKDVQFTFPGTLSLAWLFRDYKVLESGQIMVRRISISPRLGTEKGVAEDLYRTALVRATAR